MKNKPNVQTQVQKEMPEFAAEASSLSPEGLVNRVVQCSKDAEEVDNAKEADEGLQQAKEEARLLGAPYSDAKKAIKLKIRYLLALLEEKGK